VRTGRWANRRDEASSRFWQIALRETAKSHVRCCVHVTRDLCSLLWLFVLGPDHCLLLVAKNQGIISTATCQG